jgi:hypothetical protein
MQTNTRNSCVRTHHRVLFALALGSLLRTNGTSESQEQTALRLSSWSVHPLGQGFISDILKRLMHHGDLQTVAVLSCVLHDAESEVVADALRLGGARRQAEAARFGMLAHDLRQQCDHFMEEYAMVLRCRGFPLLSAAVRAQRWQVDAEVDESSVVQRGRSFGISGRERERDLERGRDWDRRTGSVADEPSSSENDHESSGGAVATAESCGICNLPVLGLGNKCLACGHVGHLECLRGWFLDAGMSSCPVGCGCQCCYHIT